MRMWRDLNIHIPGRDQREKIYDKFIKYYELLLIQPNLKDSEKKEIKEDISFLQKQETIDLIDAFARPQVTPTSAISSHSSQSFASRVERMSPAQHKRLPRR